MSLIYPAINFQFVLFTDDTSIIIMYHPDGNYFQNFINYVFANLYKWFKANKLTIQSRQNEICY